MHTPAREQPPLVVYQPVASAAYRPSPKRKRVFGPGAVGLLGPEITSPARVEDAVMAYVRPGGSR